MSQRTRRAALMGIGMMIVGLLALSCAAGQASPGVSEQRGTETPSATVPYSDLLLTNRVESLASVQAQYPTMTAEANRRAPTLAAQADLSATARAQANGIAQASTATAQAHARATLEALPDDVSSFFPLPWPIAPLTNDQIAEARACDVAASAEARYPVALGIDQLAGAYLPASACDWAILAAAYAARAAPGGVPSEEGKQAFYRAVLLNPAYALASPLLYGYFDTVALVEPPPVAERMITAVAIHYSQWNPLTYCDKGSSYTILITHGDSAPLVSGVIATPQNDAAADQCWDTSWMTSATFRGRVPVSAVQALRSGLSDLVPFPILHEYSVWLPSCADQEEWTSWRVQLFFDDGSTLGANDMGQAFLIGGGPWRVIFGGQSYLQYSAAFLRALDGLAVALNLPDTPLDSTVAARSGCEVSGGDDLLDSLMMAWW